MQIFIKAANSTFAVDVPVNATVDDLKAAVEEAYFVSADSIRFAKDSVTLESLVEVAEDDILELLVDVSGGMRAKWRKKRMRRLRRKRRKMRMRAK